MRDMWKPAAALGLAAAMALSVATPAAAAPVLTSQTAVKAAIADEATQVRWRGRGFRGHGWIPGAAAGLAAGALIGGAIATSPYHGGYYAYDPAPGPYYGYGAYPYSGTHYYYGSRRDGYVNRSCTGGYDSSGAPC